MKRILNCIRIAIITLGFTGCGNGGKREADRLGSSEVQQILPDSPPPMKGTPEEVAPFH
ncbi:MAG: hypothetical protein HDS71_01480 [Bacteroidales bacterium]|nr:hypothetical protein [Bacteroidales bacterium]